MAKTSWSFILGSVLFVGCTAGLLLVMTGGRSRPPAGGAGAGGNTPGGPAARGATANKIARAQLDLQSAELELSKAQAALDNATAMVTSARTSLGGVDLDVSHEDEQARAARQKVEAAHAELDRMNVSPPNGTGADLEVARIVQAAYDRAADRVRSAEDALRDTERQTRQRKDSLKVNRSRLQVALDNAERDEANARRDVDVKRHVVEQRKLELQQLYNVTGP